MSKEPIYPLEQHYTDETQDIISGQEIIERSVNQRLAPIFRALADDPDGWEFEWLFSGTGWEVPPENFIPSSHDGCNNFRLVPKRKTITVTIPVPVVCNTSESYSESSIVEFKTAEDSQDFVGAIRKAMEGK